ncbi:MAG: bifunctional oligoribonuclease/PAP phosphatase NrnA [Clostridia bacterium]
MFEAAKDLVKKSNKIYIVGHINPDGDAIGAACAMCLALRKMGKDASVICPSVADCFLFLPKFQEQIGVIESEYDLLICVDSGNIERLAIDVSDFEKAKKVLLLDHHQISRPCGDINCIRADLPATCELVYNFLQVLDVEMDCEIATYLYTGIMTDTGSFNYASTRPSTMYIVSKLFEQGIDFSDICQRLNHTIKEEKLKLVAKTIDNMEVYFDGKLRYSYVDQKEISNIGILDEDAEGMTNYLRDVEGTEVAIHVRQRIDGTNKVSIRSAGKVDVANIAIAFGGGGHARASGFVMPGEYMETKKELINMVEVMLKC